jgi:predicted acetyltransferase
MLRLIYPSNKYKKSFLKSLKKRLELDDVRYKKELNDILDNFALYIKKTKDYREGLSLTKGFVPENRYWLIDKDEFIGQVSIRRFGSKKLSKVASHIGYYINPYKRNKGYGKLILQMALRKAKVLGIKKVIITCNEKNIPSKKIIESNGGLFIDKFYDENLKRYTLKYSIKIK